MAVRAHGDQKYGDDPYVVHLDEVAALCAPYGEMAEAIGYLHDTMEDTDLTRDEIEAELGAVVADCVEALTDAHGANRKERKRLTYARMAAVDAATDLRLTLVAKAADRLANLRRCVKDSNRPLLEMYRKEHPDFRRAVFRPGLNEALIAEIDRIVAS
ncbi:MAG TPA: HD domain-containing protein [Labilithrix sp.]|nr:HD domain-containing protein [Labilithrix sp.]